jgi:hypothetical protein
MALTDIDVKSLLKMAERGNKVMLASTMFSRYLKDTLNFESYRFYFSPLALKKYATSLLAKDSLCWVGDSAVYSPRTFYFYPQLCSSYFWGDSLPGKELARKALHVNEYRYEVEVDSVSTESEQDTLRYVPVAMTCPVGKGEVILVSTPLIFTNYGILIRLTYSACYLKWASFLLSVPKDMSKRRRKCSSLLSVTFFPGNRFAGRCI